ncbi:MAG: hypothetical protein KGZ48_10905 [Dethiobacter sp.]|nr:hypothetical protein [Dethiobacter sp.]MBS4053813.1 hypothetical protein [Thermaerobacter sp.]
MQPRSSFTAVPGQLTPSSAGHYGLAVTLLSLPEGDTEKLFVFFKEYGFFFPISTVGYEAIDVGLLHELINRIKAVVRLMSELGEPRKNYRSILGLVLYLQLSQPINLPFQCFGEQVFQTCEHQLYTELRKASILPHTDNPQYVFHSDTYEIVDTIFLPTFQLNIEEYNNIVGGFDTSTPGVAQSQLYRDITRMYRNMPNLTPELRKMIDFLFHFQHSIGIIKGYKPTGDIEFYDTDANVRKRYAQNFGDRMKHALIDNAKVTVRDEVGYNLYGMRPRYDIETMSPAWEIEDMLTGIYISIFYMKPGIELYRRCGNPNCDRSFLVKTTSSKRKYCTSACRNSSAQRAHRLRKKETG